MPVDPILRALEVDIPSQPDALVRLSLLLAEDDVNLAAAASLIERDMALAAAVLKAVNSSLYGLSGRVQSVQQAITYLGLREVSAITFEIGLRAAFPGAPELLPLWDRSAERGFLMSRLGNALDVDAWACHTAGLFEECGKAVLFRHNPATYRRMLANRPDDTRLCAMEVEAFGVSHDALGAAMCESWGIGLAAAGSVRHHVKAQATGELPAFLPKRTVLAISVIAHAMQQDPEQLDDLVERVAPQADLDPTLCLRGARKVQDQLQQARERATL